MLAGKQPFQADYDAAVLYQIVNEQPETLLSLRDDILGTVTVVVDKCLEKDPEQRYQSIKEVVAELSESLTPTSKPEPQKSIIVLPFEDISPEGDNEYFSDGLTEEIITDLSHVSDLLVISRNSAMTFKGTKKRTSEIARTVNVRYVLEGSVRKAGNNLRITAQLIDAATDAHLWAEKYSGTLEDVFGIQENVSRSIVDALRLKLSPEENQKLSEDEIDDVRAYECYFRVRREFWSFSQERLNRAIQDVTNGLELIGDNEVLYAAMGKLFWQCHNAGISGDDTFLKKAEGCVEKIFNINPRSHYGHNLNGMVKIKRGDLQGAVNNLKIALESNLEDADILWWLAASYALAGKPKAMSPLVNKLLQIDPLTPVNHCLPGYINLLEGRFDLALGPYRKYLQMEPTNPDFRFFSGIVRAYNGLFDEALSLFDLVIQDTPGSLHAWLSSFIRYALKGDKEQAIQSVNQDLINIAEGELRYSEVMAEGYSLINEKVTSLDWLEHAINCGWIAYPFLNEYDPFLENIRSEPRFKKLMERVKYEWEHFEV